MKMLIAVSSKHGSTAEIAASIGETVRETGIEVDVVDARDVESVAPYDAVIVGSAVHMGRWMGPARDLVNGSAEALRTRRVWLFSSGPLGRDIVDPADAAQGMRLLELVGGREHRVFPGKADRQRARLRRAADPVDGEEPVRRPSRLGRHPRVGHIDRHGTRRDPGRRPNMTTIETNRLIVRPFRPDDWRDLLACLSLPEITRSSPANMPTPSRPEPVRTSGHGAVCSGRWSSGPSDGW